MNDNQFEVDGLTVRIEQDTDAESPRDWDNLGTMVCFHRRYTLGDKHEFGTPQDFANFAKNKESDIAFMLPLYLYDHSGISISTESFIGRAHHAEWDSGQVGYIYITKAKIREEYDVKRITKKLIERVKGYLKNEVENYDQFLTGDVY